MAYHPETDSTANTITYSMMWRDIAALIGNSPSADKVAAELTETLWALYRLLDRYADAATAAEIMRLAARRYLPPSIDAF